MMVNVPLDFEHIKAIVLAALDKNTQGKQSPFRVLFRKIDVHFHKNSDKIRVQNVDEVPACVVLKLWSYLTQLHFWLVLKFQKGFAMRYGRDNVLLDIQKVGKFLRAFYLPVRDRKICRNDLFQNVLYFCRCFIHPLRTRRIYGMMFFKTSCIPASVPFLLYEGAKFFSNT